MKVYLERHRIHLRHCWATWAGCTATKYASLFLGSVVYPQGVHLLAASGYHLSA